MPIDVISELTFAQKAAACFRMLFKGSKPASVIRHYKAEKDPQQSWPNGADRKVIAHYHSTLTGLELKRSEYYFDNGANFLAWFRSIFKKALDKQLGATVVLELHSRFDGNEQLSEIVI